MTSLRSVLVALTMTAALGAQSAPAPAALPKEVASLQGAWTVTSFNDQDPGGALEVQFENTRYAVVINGGVDESGTFKLDASKTPWTFDLTIQEGNDAGKVQLGILEMKGDAIHGLLAEPGAAARPANFDSADGAIAFVAVKKK